MRSPKIKLNINVKDKNLSKQLQDYVENEFYVFLESDELVLFSEISTGGEDFYSRYKKFLNSEMKKGQEVDQDILKRFIKDCADRYDMDVNGTDEEPYKTLGKRFGTIVRNLNMVCFENKEVN